MIKCINHQNFLTTPFVAVKSWDLRNNLNVDIIVIEDNGIDAIILDYVDYNSGVPILDGTCDIAQEQQNNSNILYYEEGITGSGDFNPSTDSINEDGTFKRLVHSQTKLSFYNSYKNPVEIYGVDYIDFPLSQTLRNLSDYFRMFTVPQSIFGDRMVPNTIKFTDTTLDDNVEVFDDGYQNLIAGYNLFSKIQEVRFLGNIIMSGTATNNCPYYGKPIPSPSISVNDTGSLNIGFLFGGIQNFNTDTVSVTSSIAFNNGLLFDVIVSGSCNDTGSMNIGFGSGLLFDILVSGSWSDTGSMNIGFDSGLIFTENIPLNFAEPISMSIGFGSGYISTP